MAPFTGCRPTNQGSEGRLPYSAMSLISVAVWFALIVTLPVPPHRSPMAGAVCGYGERGARGPARTR